MRRSLVSAAVLVFVACDSGVDGHLDLDVGSFIGTDGDVRVGGGAFNRAGEATAQGAASVPLWVDYSDASGTTIDHRRVEVLLPLGGGLAVGTYALSAEQPATAVWWRENEPQPEEAAVEGTVTVERVEWRDGYAEIHGTLDLTFDSGAVVGTFRAVDAGAPLPVSGCTTLGGCTDY